MLRVRFLALLLALVCLSLGTPAVSLPLDGGGDAIAAAGGSTGDSRPGTPDADTAPDLDDDDSDDSDEDALPVSPFRCTPALAAARLFARPAADGARPPLLASIFRPPRAA